MELKNEIKNLINLLYFRETTWTRKLFSRILQISLNKYSANETTKLLALNKIFLNITQMMPIKNPISTNDLRCIVQATISQFHNWTIRNIVIKLRKYSFLTKILLTVVGIIKIAKILLFETTKALEAIFNQKEYFNFIQNMRISNWIIAKESCQWSICVK